MFFLDKDGETIAGAGINSDLVSQDILQQIAGNQLPVSGGTDPVKISTLVSGGYDHIILPHNLSVNSTESLAKTTSSDSFSADLLIGSHAENHVNSPDHQAAILTDALTQSVEQLQDFANSPDFLTQMGVAFGDHFNTEVAQSLAEQWSAGLVETPPIEVISTADINGANGAFAAASNTIYISEEFLAQNYDNVENISTVLLEEYGHYIDTLVNVTDTPGDEGAIFSGVVQGNEFEESELEALQAVDDTAIVILNGEETVIEQSYNNVVRSSPGFTKNRGGWSDNNNYPRLTGDVNGDGRTDIVGFGASDVFVSLANSNGTFRTPVRSKPSSTNAFTKNVGGWSDNNNYPRLLGDVNGDGRADIIGFGASDVFVSLSNGNGTFRAPVRSSPGFTKNRGSWTDNNNYPRIVRDVNGDGRADIVGFGASDVFVSLGNSNGTFGTATRYKPSSTNAFTKNVGGWSDNNNYPRLLGDINGDRKADIIGFGASDVFTSLWGNTVTPTPPPPSNPGNPQPNPSYIYRDSDYLGALYQDNIANDFSRKVHWSPSAGRDTSAFDSDDSDPNGVDRDNQLYAIVGGEVIEAKNGREVSSKYWGYNGTVAIYNKDLNKTFIYWHLQEGSINESMKGKTISSGSLIGREGNTGSSYGDHTHVEVHNGRAYINMSNPSNPQSPANSGRLDVASVFQDAVRKGLVKLYR
ncbi:MAG: FG-GAP-like repeat-containing protein [Lyngbya sp.]|nr:FG-GAP-like repeat-containing protein [Lyngbya sp.]